VIVAVDGYYSCLDAGSYRGPLEKVEDRGSATALNGRRVLTALRSHAKVRPPTRGPRSTLEPTDSIPSKARDSQRTRLLGFAACPSDSERSP
jgi:hypothetical protein